VAQTTWEKPLDAQQQVVLEKLNGKSSERLKFLLGGVLLLGAVFYLLFSSTVSGARFFITVDEVVNNPEYVGKTVRLTGVVLGETINLDTSNPNKIVIEFTIANIPRETTNLAETLHQAAKDPTATRLQIYVEGQPKPELLQHEAQAILTGIINEDGIFHASELQFKCPSRFDDAGPNVGSAADHPGMMGSQS
jgi:cytochrome c-type biogenesis protein CcmE